MAAIIYNLEEAYALDLDKVEVDPQWNSGDFPENQIHTIHTYPARFPAFIADRAIKYAQTEGIKLTKISDVFCGCGTVAFEAKRHGVDFWGCDINPVATLIARVKIQDYSTATLEHCYYNILQKYNTTSLAQDYYQFANERLKYWFDMPHYNDLKRLIISIDSLPNSKYKQAFRCLFSSILKSTSRWLTKSIKPQIDPQKKPADVLQAFTAQYEHFIKIINNNHLNTNAKAEIITGNFLTKRSLPFVDLLVTSPPYVTSYEYADLHQLSSLWLGYSSDYKALRKGSIGSVYNSEHFFIDPSVLNHTGGKITQQLKENKCIDPSLIRSIARYFVDMQHATTQCFRMLNNPGIAVFVVGDTEYKGTKILNSQHLVESLLQSGFHSVCISKRRITGKILTPYRDEKGRFTTDKNKREVYHEEYVIIGKNY